MSDMIYGCSFGSSVLSPVRRVVTSSSRGSTRNYPHHHSPPHTEYNYVNPLVCAVFVALCPLWVLIARRIPSTRELLYSGWEPVIIAMAISR